MNEETIQHYTMVRRNFLDSRKGQSRKSFQFMKQNLEKLCVDNGMFADITFELDDGRMRAHRAMLVARCEVMRAMLNGDFREAHAKLVSS